MLAEYHRELLERYDMFWLDTSYGSYEPSIDTVQGHMTYYLGKNCDTADVFLGGLLYRDFLALSVDNVTITAAAVATDRDGAVFRQNAARTMLEKTGLDVISKVMGWLETVEINGLRTNGYQEERERLKEELLAYDGTEKQVGKDWVTVHVENPLEQIEETAREGILHLVLENDAEVSHAAVTESELDTLASARRRRGILNAGNWPYEESLWESGEGEDFWERISHGAETVAERLLWQEYLIQHCSCYKDVSGTDMLQYQLEYLIVGQNSDVENLKGVVHRISAIREAANMLYLLSDEVKCAEAKGLAMVLAVIMGIPEAEPVVRGLLLLGWAYLESLYDIKCLLKGEGVPLFKTADTWHYSISGLFDSMFSEPDKKEELLGVWDAPNEEDNTDNGNMWDKTEGHEMSYEDYLRLLLYFTSLTDQTFRMMDVIEMELRRTPGNQYFRMDGCVDKLEMAVDFYSGYGYRESVVVKKQY